jgi:hypothetical protein
MAIFEVSKGFPPEECYALTSHIRWSSSTKVTKNTQKKPSCIFVERFLFGFGLSELGHVDA